MVSHTPFVWASTVSLVFAALAIGLAALSASNLEFVALFLLAVVFVLAAASLATVGVVLIVARGVAVATESALESGSDRLGRWALELEETNALARAVNLSGLVAPLDRRTPEERAARALEDVKARYADGALTDAEFEWELARIVELEETDTDRGSLETRRY